MESGKDDCSASFKNISFLSQSVAFSGDGKFEIFCEVTFNNEVKKSSSKVDVNSKIIPSVQIKYLPLQPINVIVANEIEVTIMNLVPKCVAYWNVVTRDGFAGFQEEADSSNFVDMGKIVIKDFEEYFLQELVDYDNNTLSKVIFNLINFKFQFLSIFSSQSQFQGHQINSTGKFSESERKLQIPIVNHLPGACNRNSNAI